VLYALCGESFAGKTTILNAVLQRDPLLGRMITYTTRSPRSDEVDHVDYHFVDVHDFEAAIHAGKLVCSICHRRQWYATSLDDLHACKSRDTLAVLRPDKIEELRQFTPTSIIGIYIVRPGLVQSTTEDDRICVTHQHLCTYQVTNISGKLDLAVTQVLNIVHTRKEVSNDVIRYYLP